MQPHFSVITLGDDDLEFAVRFYRDGLARRQSCRGDMIMQIGLLRSHLG